MSNYSSKPCKVTAYMRMKGFTVGVNSVRSGKPFNPEQYEGDRGAQWRYEVGRQFAYIYDGPIKNGNKICMHAAYALGHALWKKEICA